MDDLAALGEQIVSILGEEASRELLDAITRPEDERAKLIGRLYVRDDATWLALLLTDIETDEMLRLQLAEALSLVLPST